MTAAPTPALYALTPEQHAAVLFILGHYAGLLAATPAKLTPGLPMLSHDSVVALAKSLDHTGLDFGAATQLFGTDEDHDAFVIAAQREVREGELEVDSPTVVSRGDDDGAYVQAWIWVDNDDARSNVIDGYDTTVDEDGCVVEKVIKDEPYTESLANLILTGKLFSTTGLGADHKVKRATINKIVAWAAIVAASCPFPAPEA